MKKLIVLFLFSSMAMAESYNLLCKNNIDKSLVDVYISYSKNQIDYEYRVGYWYKNGSVRFNNKSYDRMTVLAKDNYIQIEDVYSNDIFRYYKETKNLKRYANKMVSDYSCKDVNSLLD
tara:strand:+ start:55 stop:411 length:357 start_codon:yes stop_codon:yes gene_type:complete